MHSTIHEVHQDLTACVETMLCSYSLPLEMQNNCNINTMFCSSSQLSYTVTLISMIKWPILGWFDLK